MGFFDSSRLPAAPDELLRSLGGVEDRSPFDSALASIALLATGMLLGTGLSRLLAARDGASIVPAADARGVRPLTET